MNFPCLLGEKVIPFSKLHSLRPKYCNGEEFSFLRINQKSEFAKVVMLKTPSGSYSGITSMLEFIMREAVSQWPCASKNSSKDVSMEDEFLTLPSPDT
ncbi:hypothetical protein N7519_003280 [Penicillium mononematosum]|uniref:uncharacterized protein n=1 Tax=Penicillium mononematosum TaxID=268346 RepID=UPI0025497ED8|nr:uncharacterized protein N7519_003280 [Penicillium mononematosum]KAJ6188372.1 hypothetical protein N7519_003280 [Penicillium mononematosum]